MKPQHRHILTLSCPDRPGIVFRVAETLFGRGCNVLDSAQFSDPGTGLFFMRVIFSAERGGPLQELRDAFAPVAEAFAMSWEMHDAAVPPKLLIMVSRFGHCLNDLLYRYRIGALAVEIPAIVSNHRDFYQLAASYNIPFHYLPVTKDNKALQEAKLREIVDEEAVDLVVLARYMQVLGAETCECLSGRIINIHHSFLPSFRGAKPYQQAHERGVKLIGATAHYVTAVLDEGPIIDQEVVRVNHSMTPEDLAAAGRDIEAMVLARAVKAHVERRVLINGNRTVVFG
jgi:formyltetrahydrofolate deformylase